MKEVEPKKRGRKAGEVYNVTIKDKVLDPFYIKVDESCFAVFKINDPNGFAYCSNLSNALNKIVKLQLALPAQKDKQYSLAEFINQYTQATKTISQTIKF